MTKNDIASKLAQGIRQARNPANTTEPQVAPPPAPAPAAAAKTQTIAKTPPKPNSATHYASQADQVPAPSLDSAWGNLHPERIWPD